jgi:hypothetical protein
VRSWARKELKILQLDDHSVYIKHYAYLDTEMVLMCFGAWEWQRFTFIVSLVLQGFIFICLIFSFKRLSTTLISLNLKSYA